MSLDNRPVQRASSSSDPFDPYFKWLGIPKAHQPPHAYRLLGIELFESDPDVISNAADGRMTQLKSFQSGKNADISQKLLNEISAAKLCLLNKQKKADYDRRLQARLAKHTAVAAVVAGEPTATEVDAEDPLGDISFITRATTASTISSVRSTEKSKQRTWFIPAAISVGAIAVILGGVAYFSLAGDGRGQSSNAQNVSSATNSHEERSNPTPTSSDKRAADLVPAIAKTPIVATPALPEKKLDPTTDSVPDLGKSALATSETETETKEKPGNELAANLEKATDSKKDESKSEESTEQGAATKSPDTQEAVKKLAQPDKDLLQAMRTKILQIFQKEFAEAKTADAKLALALKLDAQGDASKDDAVERYSLWKFAAEGACVAGDFANAMKIVDKIQATFDMDGDTLKTDLLNTSSTRTTLSPEGARKLCEAALGLSAETMSREDWDTASRLVHIATVAVRRTKDAQLSRDVLSRGHEIDRLKTRFAAVAKAKETLAGVPNDADANLTIGQWQCFVKEDWEKGLPYLAKGSREDLASLAKLETAKPSGPKEQVALADAWRTLAEKDRTDSKAAYQARAGYWYEQALPNLTGLEKTRVEKQIAALSISSGPEVRGRGVVQKGNVALATNGTTMTGLTVEPNVMLGDDNKPWRASQGATPCEVVVTFDKMYQLQEMRIYFGYRDKSFAYSVLVSRDGRRFELLEDHSKDPRSGLQDLRFAARPVKIVKIVLSEKDKWFGICKFEAYCQPPPAEGMIVKPPRGRKR